MTRSRRVLLAAGALLGLGVAAVVGPNLWIAHRAAGHLYAAADVPPAPVALVFGAGITADARPTPYLAYRLDLAKTLWESGKVRVILVSGDNRTHDYDEPTAMMDYLVAQGVPPDRVVRDFAGRDTYDSCARARRIFGVEHLIAVTQEFHLARAVATCRALGLEADGVGDVVGKQYPGPWASGVQREKLAAVKTAYDLASGRDPILGRAESSVRDALAAP